MVSGQDASLSSGSGRLARRRKLSEGSNMKSNMSSGSGGRNIQNRRGTAIAETSAGDEQTTQNVFACLSRFTGFLTNIARSDNLATHNLTKRQRPILMVWRAFIALLLLINAFMIPVLTAYVTSNVPRYLWLFNAELAIGLILLADEVPNVIYFTHSSSPTTLVIQVTVLEVCGSIPWLNVAWMLFGSQLSENSAPNKMIKLLHLVKILRFIRLSAYVRCLVSCIAVPFPNLVESKPVGRLAKLALFTILYGNVFAALYYVLAEKYDPTEPSWLDNDGLRPEAALSLTETDIIANLSLKEESSLILRSVTRSVYFLVQTLLTVGYGDNAPQREETEGLASLLSILGVLFLAFLVANMTSLFVNLNAMASRFKTDQETVSSFLEYRRMPEEVTNRVQSSFDVLWETNRGFLSWKLFNNLPPSLTADINFEVIGKKLAHIPLLHGLSAELLEKVSEAGHTLYFKEDEMVLDSAEQAPQLFVVLQGVYHIQYAQRVLKTKPVESSSSAVQVLSDTNTNNTATTMGDQDTEYDYITFSTLRHGSFNSPAFYENKRVSPFRVIAAETSSIFTITLAQLRGCFAGEKYKDDQELQSLLSHKSDHRGVVNTLAIDAALEQKYLSARRRNVRVSILGGEGPGKSSRKLLNSQTLLSEGDSGHISPRAALEDLAIGENRRAVMLGTGGHQRSSRRLVMSSRNVLSSKQNQVYPTSDSSNAQPARLPHVEITPKLSVAYNRKRIKKGSWLMKWSFVHVDLCIWLIQIYIIIITPFRYAFVNDSTEMSAWIPIMVVIEFVFDGLQLYYHVVVLNMRNGEKGALQSAAERRSIRSPSGFRPNNTRSIKSSSVSNHHGRSRVSSFAEIRSDQHQALENRRVELLQQRRRQVAIFITAVMSIISFLSGPPLSVFSEPGNYTLWIQLRLPFILNVIPFFASVDRMKQHLSDFGYHLSHNQVLFNTLFSTVAISIHIGSCMACAVFQDLFLDMNIRSALNSVGSEEAIEILGWENVTEAGVELLGGVAMIDIANYGVYYTQGLYWILVTITTVGFGDITPSGNSDTIFTICIMIAGVTLFSGSLSFVTTLLNEVEISEHNVVHHRACLTRYMLDREINSNLQSRVLNYLDYVHQHETVTHKRLFGICPSTGKINDYSDYVTFSCRQELLFATVGSLLRTTTLLQGVDDEFLKAIASLLRYRLFSPGDVMSAAGSGAKSKELRQEFMTFLGSGEFQEINGQGIEVAKGTAPASFGVVSLIDTSLQGLSTYEARTFCECWLLYGSQVKSLTVNFPAQVEKFFVDVRERVAKAEAAVAKSGKHNKLAKMAEMGKQDLGQVGPPKPFWKRQYLWPANSKLVIFFNMLSFMGSAIYIIANPLNIAFTQRGVPFDSQSWTSVLLYVVDCFFLVDLYMRLAHFVPKNSFADGHNPDDVTGGGNGVSGGGTDDSRYGGWQRVGYLKRVRGLGGAYLRSWIGCLALFAVLPVDWVIVSILTAPTARLLSLIRLNRFYRAPGMLQQLNEIGGNIKSVSKKNYVRMTKLLYVLLLTTHVVGCFFHLIMVIESETEIGFLTDIFKPTSTVITNALSSESPSYTTPGRNETIKFISNDEQNTVYIEALYWAVSTITAVGYGDITPTTYHQYLYTIFVLLLGAMIYSILISNLEQIVAQADGTSTLFQIRQDRLKRFMAWRRLPNGMRGRVSTFMMELWLQQRGVDEPKIWLFLNETLRSAIIINQCPSILADIPVLGSKDTDILKYLLPRMNSLICPAGQLVYDFGEVGDRLFYLQSGEVELVSETWDTVYSTVNALSQFGADEFFRNFSYDSGARAAVTSNVFYLRREVVTEFLELNPSFNEPYNAALRKYVRTKKSNIAGTQKNLKSRKVTKMMKVEDNTQIRVHKEWVIMPSSPYRRLWDLVLVMVLLFYCFSVPFKIGFLESVDGLYETSIYANLMILDIICLVLLAVNMLCKSRIFAAVQHGVVIKEQAKITAAYMGAPLFGDLIVLIPFNIVVTAMTSSLWLGSISQLTKLLLLKDLGHLHNSLDNAIDENKLYLESGYRHLARLLMIVFVACHWVACGRNLILWSQGSFHDDEIKFSENNGSIHNFPGNLAENSEYEMNWNNGTETEHNHVQRRYINALYYAVFTITTTGYGNVSVTSNLEKLFAIVAMITGTFLCDAGLTSTLCSVIDTIDMSNSESKRERDCMQHIAQYAKLPVELVLSLNEFYDHRQGKQRNLDEVAILRDYLPETFVVEVMGALALRKLGNVFEYSTLAQLNNGMLRSLLVRLKPRLYLKGDVIFAHGEPMEKLIFVVSGNVAPMSPEHVIDDISSVDGIESDDEDEVHKDHQFKGATIEPENPKDHKEGGHIDNADVEVDPCSGGLLCGHLKWKGACQWDFVATQTTETLVCTKEAYEEVTHTQYKIGGQFHNLTEMLSDQLAAAQFAKFVEHRTQSPAHVHFYVDVAKYRRMTDGAAATYKFKEAIFTKYLVGSAKEMVALTSVVLKETMNARNDTQAGLDIFNTAQAEVLEWLENKMIKDFLDSSYSQELFKKRALQKGKSSRAFMNQSFIAHGMDDSDKDDEAGGSVIYGFFNNKSFKSTASKHV